MRRNLYDYVLGFPKREKRELYRKIYFDLETIRPSANFEYNYDEKEVQFIYDRVNDISVLVSQISTFYMNYCNYFEMLKTIDKKSEDHLHYKFHLDYWYEIIGVFTCSYLGKVISMFGYFYQIEGKKRIKIINYLKKNKSSKSVGEILSKVVNSESYLMLLSKRHNIIHNRSETKTGLYNKNIKPGIIIYGSYPGQSAEEQMEILVNCFYEYIKVKEMIDDFLIYELNIKMEDV